MTKGTQTPDFSFQVTIPQSGWGINASNEAPALSGGRRYWKQDYSSGLINGLNTVNFDLSKEVSGEAPENWCVYSYDWNTNSENRLDETWRIPASVLLDDSAVFVATLQYLPFERFKRWPFTFSKNGIPRKTRAIFGQPPIVITGEYRKKGEDPSIKNFYPRSYFYLVMKRQHCLRGTEAADNGVANHGSYAILRSEAANDPGEWSFGWFQVDSSETTKVLRSLPQPLQFLYTCDGRELNKVYKKDEIELRHKAFWFDKLIQDRTVPFCVVDGVFPPSTLQKPAVEIGTPASITVSNTKPSTTVSTAARPHEETSLRKSIAFSTAADRQPGLLSTRRIARPTPLTSTPVDSSRSSALGKRQGDDAPVGPNKRHRSDRQNCLKVFLANHAQQTHPFQAVEETHTWNRQFEAVDKSGNDIGKGIPRESMKVGNRHEAHSNRTKALVKMFDNELKDLGRAALDRDQGQFDKLMVKTEVLRDAIQSLRDMQPANQALQLGKDKPDDQLEESEPEDCDDLGISD